MARIVAAAALQPGESVLDAGAGVGSLTAPIAAAVAPGGSVLAVETDAAAAEALRRLEFPATRVVEGDVLKVRWPEPLDAVVANPPFRILPALLRRILAHGFGRAVLVMPRELADRLTAEPATEAYGRFTIEVGVQAKCRLLFPLSRKAFDPPPAVPCCVVHLVPRAGATLPAPELAPLLDAAWAARERTLRHSLAPLAATLGIPPAEVTEALATVNGGGRTAAQLSPWEYGQLAARLGEAVGRRSGSQKGVRQNP